jgi:hypothetical protein
MNRSKYISLCRTMKCIIHDTDEGTLLQSIAPGNSSDEKLKSQKIYRSEPRRTLNIAIYPDVQWRDSYMADRLHEHGGRNKVSMIFWKRVVGGPRIYTII